MIYILELTRWGIKNDGIEAENTSKGINNALLWASQNGYTEVVFPKGTYLIDENNPIKPQSYTSINLNGSTLKIRPNGLTTYNIVSIVGGIKNIKLTNGKIEGDKDTHDYTTIQHTHEFGMGIEIKHNASFVTLDNLEIFNTTGDAIIAITSYGAFSRTVMPPLSGNLESGGISKLDGALVPSSTRIRSTVKLPMTLSDIQKYGYFGLYGDSYGGLGSEIIAEKYDVFFYRADDSFLLSVPDVNFFDEVPVPKDAYYAKVVIHQSTIPSINGNAITIRTPIFPSNIYIEKCDIHHCRRLGIGICGTKHFYVRDCNIYNIGGVSPAGGIDIEDGYDLNQYIYIENNNIHSNRNYSITAIAGRHIIIKGNRLEKGIFTISKSVEQSIVDGNFFIKAGPRLEGETIFTNNYLYDSRLSIGETIKNVLIDNCLFLDCPIELNKPKAYTVLIDNCKFQFSNEFYTASDSRGTPFVFLNEAQTLSNSTIEGYGVNALILTAGKGFNWIFNNVTFLNTKHPADIVTSLPPGEYTRCRFINTGRLSLSGTGIEKKHVFNDCYFEWDSTYLFYVYPTIEAGLFRINNCYFKSKKSGQALYLRGDGIWGIIEIVNSKFDYPSADLINSSMISLINPSIKSIRIEGNTFHSNIAMIGINALNQSSSTPFIFANNHSYNVRILLNSGVKKLNNFINGQLEPQ